MCGHSQINGEAAALSVPIGVPRVNTTVSLERCLDIFAKSTERKQTKCTACRKVDGITASRRIRQLAKYAVMNIARVDDMGKIRTRIPIPTGKLNLAPWFASLDSGKNYHHEVIAVAEHRGEE